LTQEEAPDFHRRDIGRRQLESRDRILLRRQAASGQGLCPTEELQVEDRGLRMEIVA